jgi:hypothetical protein
MSINFEEIAERIKKALSIKKDGDLARMMGLSPQSFYGFKKKGFPMGKLILFAYAHGISTDWLFFGKPPVDNLDRLEKIITAVEGKAFNISPEKKTRLIRIVYEEVAFRNRDLLETLTRYEELLA